jgi:hypothetical protein
LKQNGHIYDEGKRLKKELDRVTQERDLLIKPLSRKVVGWSMDRRMKAKPANDALLMAIL